MSDELKVSVGDVISFIDDNVQMYLVLSINDVGFEVLTIRSYVKKANTVQLFSSWSNGRFVKVF